MSATGSRAYGAVTALTRFRVAERMRFSDGWMLKQLRPEIRDGRPVFGFVLEAWSAAGEASFDLGDEVCGCVDGGRVDVEQHV